MTWRNCAIVLVATTLACLFGSGAAISCYQCDSNDHLYCSERWGHGLTPNVQPQNCSHLHEARYCVKATGMYQGRIGTFRFCSSRDWGYYCDYPRRPGDEREYRACIYTCYTDGCNGAPRGASRGVLLLALPVLAFLFLTRN